MKVTILTQFRDKNNYSHVFNVGEVVEFDDERAARIIELGYGQSAEESPEKEAPMQPTGEESEQVKEQVNEEATEEVDETAGEAQEPIAEKPRRGRKANK